MSVETFEHMHRTFLSSAFRDQRFSWSSEHMSVEAFEYMLLALSFSSDDRPFQLPLQEN